MPSVLLAGPLPLLALLALAAPSPDLQDPVTISLSYEAPEGCGDRAAFLAELERRATWIVADATRSPAVLLSVALSKTAAGVEGRLELSRDSGAKDERRLSGATCQEVLGALALTAVLALDPADGARSQRAPQSGNRVVASEPAPAGPATPSPPGPDAAHPIPVARGVEHAAAAPHASASSPVLWRVGVSSVATQVVSPALSLGAAASVAVRQKSDAGWEPNLSAMLLHVPTRLLQPPSAVSVGWTAMALASCPVTVRSASASWAVEPCATTSVGWLSVSHRRVTEPETSRRLSWHAGVLVAGETLVADSVHLVLRTAATTPLLRRHFVIENPSRPAARTPLVCWAFTLGAQLEL